jgi:hypothetical protein
MHCAVLLDALVCVALVMNRHLEVESSCWFRAYVTHRVTRISWIVVLKKTLLALCRTRVGGRQERHAVQGTVDLLKRPHVLSKPG